MQVAKSEKTNEQLNKDLNTMKTKYNEAVEEVKEFLFNALYLNNFA